MIQSYSSIYNIGHKQAAPLLECAVLVEEKVDGSQFSFRLNHDNTVEFRSKGAEIFAEAAPKMFNNGVKAVMERKEQLLPGVVYRGEYLEKPKHNALSYDRTPVGHVVIFDIEGEQEGSFYNAEKKRVLALKGGFECMPVLFQGVLSGPEQVKEFLERTSFLGGQKIEGVVVKPLNYDIFDPGTKKCLMAKYVSEAFKEVHSQVWRVENPSDADFYSSAFLKRKTYARWEKAIQHLKEAGQLTDSPKDIGPLMKEINTDVLKEEKEEMMREMFEHAWKKHQKLLTLGFPQWYKERVMEKGWTTEADPSA